MNKELEKDIEIINDIVNRYRGRLPDIDTQTGIINDINNECLVYRFGDISNSEDIDNYIFKYRAIGFDFPDIVISFKSDNDIELSESPLTLGPSQIFTESAITFSIKDEECLRIEEDGKFYVNGRLTTEDIEIYKSLKRFVTQLDLDFKDEEIV